MKDILDQRDDVLYQEDFNKNFPKNVCSGAEGGRREYCFRQSVLDMKR